MSEIKYGSPIEYSARPARRLEFRLLSVDASFMLVADGTVVRDLALSLAESNESPEEFGVYQLDLTDPAAFDFAGVDSSVLAALRALLPELLVTGEGHAARILAQLHRDLAGQDEAECLCARLRFRLDNRPGRIDKAGVGLSITNTQDLYLRSWMTDQRGGYSMSGHWPDGEAELSSPETWKAALDDLDERFDAEVLAFVREARAALVGAMGARE